MSGEAGTAITVDHLVGRQPAGSGSNRRAWFRIEPAGPSRWSTARALIVLRRWEGAAR